jgi:hypothetical protein
MRFLPPPLHGNARALDEAVERGERNRYRLRGWSIAFGVALLVWALVGGAVVLVIGLLR